VQCGIARFGQDMAATLMAWLSEGAKPLPDTRSPVQLVVRGSSHRS
jgi:LacI family transcriptional regulator